jgi:metal-responsive CopG/Arc/MetJ family transcriptional regulator
MKRMMITLRQEWTNELDELKKSKFYNVTFSEMFRVLISLGMKEIHRLDDQNKDTV